MSRLRGTLTYANVIATLALFFALGGVATAAGKAIMVGDEAGGVLSGEYPDPIFASTAKAPDADKLDGLDSTAFLTSDRVLSSGVVEVPVGELQTILAANGIQLRASCADNPVTAHLEMLFPSGFFLLGRHSVLHGGSTFQGTGGAIVLIASADTVTGSPDSGTYNAAASDQAGTWHVLNGDYLVRVSPGNRRCQFETTAISD